MWHRTRATAADEEGIVTASYSMEGFSLTLNDGVIELHTDGDLGQGSEQAHARAFATLASRLHSRLILNDVRSAVFSLSSFEWEERMRFIARELKGYQTAYVVRPDQVKGVEKFVAAHERLGDTAAWFTSKAAARAWLKGQ